MFRASCRNSFNGPLPHVTHRNTQKYLSVNRHWRNYTLFAVNAHIRMSQDRKVQTDLLQEVANLKVAQDGDPGPKQSPSPISAMSPNLRSPASSIQNKQSTEKSMQMSTQVGSKFSSAAQPLPDFIVQRNQFFDKLKTQHDEEVASKERPEIKVTLNTGAGEDSMLIGKAWETTPGQLLRHVQKDIAADIIIAKVDGTLWDLDRPLEADAKVSYLSSRHPEGRAVFWHSAAHVLGEACEHEYGCQLSHGPPTAMGFFYDMALEPGRAVRESEWPSIEARAKKYFKEKQPFERLEVSKANLRKLFGYSKYKMHFIEEKVADGETSTVYRNGSLVDLCLGPHIQNTKRIEAFKIMKNSSAYFLGDQKEDSLQRIHGVAFPKKEQLKEWETFLEEAKKRDHQEIGKNQKLFMFHKLSPGSPFLLPHGTRIFNALQTMLREQYWERGYQEVQSPNMYDVELWKTSGHWQHYRNDMFRVQVKDDKPDAEGTVEQTKPEQKITEQEHDKGVFALKPMNCPGHCLMFRDEERSYRELPWRVADFGVLHRNEASGALSGMTRVRKFQQDDTHVFCTQQQVTQEIEALFNFMSNVYGLFGFPFRLKLSTRPEGYMGRIEDWNDAESRLKAALQNFRGDDWELNEGDGAFYGPKIDVTISDALKREYQCATIQLDFQLPQNFKLEYRTGETPPESAGKDEATGLSPGMARPVMIHRAIVGSFERFIAILCEHFAGKWPFWLSPRQVLVIPVMKAAEDYVREVHALFHKARMYVDIDVSGNTLQKKIRTGQLQQYNFIFGKWQAAYQ